MKACFGGACVLLHICACFAAVGPALISIDPDILDIFNNELSDSTEWGDPDAFHIDNAEKNNLCHRTETMGAIDPDINEDTKLHVPELIRKYKYDVEVHDVTTSDGYILQMHRITGGPKSPTQKGKMPVFLMHGLLDSSSTWVVMRPNHGLAYMLADQGYDVWLGNARGNTYSRRHTSFNPDGGRKERSKFWAFSWHEIGTIDLPTMIDYVLEKTEHSKLHYVGHSQGTTAFFVMCSERPEYNDKIIMMNALAPVAYAKHISSPVVRALTPFLFTLDRLMSLIGAYEFLPSCELFILGGKEACRDKAFTQAMCENILVLIAGYSTNELNATMLPVVLGHTPAGASARQLVHYGQEVRSGHFRQYDYGWIQNLMQYRRLTPPDYNLQNVKTRVAIYYSSADSLAAAADVERLGKELPNLASIDLVPHDSFNHIDFVWAIDAPRLIYTPMMNAMKNMDKEIGQ